VAFSPDAKTLATAYGDFGNAFGGVVLWDVAEGKRLIERPLTVPEGPVTSVAFSPVTNTLAAGYNRAEVGGVVLWDVAGGKRLVEGPLATTEGGVTSVAFSPDGRTLATLYGTPCRGVALWDVDLESWKRHAARVANRNFTRDEWHQYFPDEPYRATFPDLPIPPEVASHDEARSR
jgi:WD40 repeat protein